VSETPHPTFGQEDRSAMSDEDDFMSDAWLEKAKEFDRKSNADRSKKKRKEPTPQPKPVAVLEKQQREQGLAKPISENNIGVLFCFDPLS
jgi:hypothetical protein